MLLLATLVAQSVVTGCQHTPREAMSELWGAVPQVRWSGRVEPPAAPEKVEPSVSANMAATANAPVQTSNNVESAFQSGPMALENSTDKSVRQVAGSELPLNSSATFDPLNAKPIGVTESPMDLDQPIAASPQAIFADSSADQIERLKAALKDDAEQADFRSRIGSGSHEVRVRVESMLEKARRLFDVGQLREARHTARMAQEIGDSARLDFSPEEERPVDLVQRIEDQLRESEAADNSAVDQSSEAPSEPISAVEPSRTLEKTPAAKSPEPAVRQRRDWSGLTVFRRDPKSIATGPMPRPAETPNDASSSGVVKLGLETEGASETEADGAVVQANRSVTLIKAQDANPVRAARDLELAHFSGDAPSVHETGTPLVHETGDPSLESSREATTIIEEQPSELTDVSTAWLRDTEASLKVTPEETSPPPTDFDNIKPISPFREIAGVPPTNAPEPLQIEQPRSTRWDSLIAITLFGCCAMTAVFWYRRGAT